MTRYFRRLLLTLGWVFAAGLPATADDGLIDSVDEMRALQEKIRTVAASRATATVGIVTPETAASGSGVIVSEDGLILTAAHVVEGTEEVTIIFSSGDVARAEVLGLDRMRDQGMLRLLGDRTWPFAPVAEGDVEVTDWVVALGHPGGYDPVRTPPVRLGRMLSDNPSDFITTDCKLIGGDSGGPLFNLAGEVVGIHSSIGRDGTENNHASIGGFLAGWEQLRSGARFGRYGELTIGHPDGAFLGISFDPLRRSDRGVIINEILDNGPAQISGLQPGDRITHIAGAKISNATELSLEIGRYRAGQKISVGFVRNETEREVEVALLTRAEVIGG